MFDFSGKSVLVTGSSRGIGKSIIELFASLGASVAINYPPFEEEPAYLQELSTKGVDAIAIKADVSDAGEVNAMIEAHLKRFGKLDVLVNNAGITRDNLLVRMDDSDWEDVIRTNLTSVYLCSKAAIKPMMKARLGAIVNTASIVGVRGNAGQTNYSAAKAGIIGFTKSLAKEVASRNVRVNAVAPGFILTTMTDALPEEIKSEIIKRISMGRFGTAEEVAKVVVFLASDVASYVTGQVVEIDGGLAI